MYLEDYLWFVGALIVVGIISAIASVAVNRTFAKYSQVPNRSGINGRETVWRILNANGVNGVSVGEVSGSLTDHYDPTREVVNLSQATSYSNSVGAVAVAAHEAGHVLQKHKGYFLFRLRNFLVPVVNFGSRLALPLVLIGFVIDFLINTSGEPYGFYLALVGVALYGGALLFALVTLPVEIDASRRARQMLLQQGILTQEEMTGAKKVLNAAASTYLASLLVSLVYFLRFLLYVLTLFGRRRD